MRFAADERCDAQLVECLRADGHDVWYVMESAGGADDETILRRAFDDKRILLTEDKDFGELVFRFGHPVHGLVLLRLNPADSLSKVARLRTVLKRHAGKFLGSFVVISAKNVRFRRLRST